MKRTAPSLGAAVVLALGKWPHDAPGCVPPAGGEGSVRSLFLFQTLASCPLQVNKWLIIITRGACKNQSVT